MGYNDAALKDYFNGGLDDPVSQEEMAQLQTLEFWKFVRYLQNPLRWDAPVTPVSSSGVVVSPAPLPRMATSQAPQHKMHYGNKYAHAAKLTNPCLVWKSTDNVRERESGVLQNAGVPAVLVGSLLSVQQHTRPFYGTKNVNLLNSNATNPVCWITEPLILYGVNLSYFTIIFVFNTVVLITVSRQIFKLKKLDNKHKKIPVKDFSTVLGLMCLMGTSWGLVFFGSGYTSYPILYIFCISNTMQGFSIFLWLCRTVSPEKQKAAHTKSASTLDTFTIEKQKESR
ncbi:uncharacterized protein LOC113106624 [Carassius auratus]|uniref:Uncharacterized protein LOC113106624 n=1 Tax=Carassius auratus TaxID=7957 RepID=A0A6P6PUD3_CARAU|nr:uncharacterized protein LOC113106624 [Carassius auratus]